MGMKIIAIRIGDRYGPEYEKYLEEKLPEYEFIWIRKPIRDDVLLQWNKMYAMSLDIDEPVVVMDIDVLLTGNYKDLFEYPIKKGQFVSIPGWWRDTENKRYKINGGFLNTTLKIVDIFMINLCQMLIYGKTFISKEVLQKVLLMENNILLKTM